MSEVVGATEDIRTFSRRSIATSRVVGRTASERICRWPGESVYSCRISLYKGELYLSPKNFDGASCRQSTNRAHQLLPDLSVEGVLSFPDKFGPGPLSVP